MFAHDTHCQMARLNLLRRRSWTALASLDWYLQRVTES